MSALQTLMPGPLDLTGYRLGGPQQAGALTMIPVFGPAHPGIVPPRSGLKLTRVTGYGQVELRNAAPSGVAIVPLHIGYIQDAAQNHALCRSAFLGAGQTLLFEDACCVQESQGGYLAGQDQWFFVLPAPLRPRALELRGVGAFDKLWEDIAALNHRYGLPRRGHLEQILSRHRATLTRFQSRLELLPGQLGAVFLIGDRFAGLELAPDPAYFAELWMALVCFAYGVPAWHAEPTPATAPSTTPPLPYTQAPATATAPQATSTGTPNTSTGTPNTGAGTSGTSAGTSASATRANGVRDTGEAGTGPGTPAGSGQLPGAAGTAGVAGIRAALEAERAERVRRIGDCLASIPAAPIQLQEEERYLDLRLSTVTADHLTGQIVTNDNRPVYASLFATT